MRVYQQKIRVFKHQRQTLFQYSLNWSLLYAKTINNYNLKSIYFVRIWILWVYLVEHYILGLRWDLIGCYFEISVVQFSLGEHSWCHLEISCAEISAIWFSKLFRHFEDHHAYRASNMQKLLFRICINLFDQPYWILDIRTCLLIMQFEKIFDFFIGFMEKNFRNLRLDGRFNISKASGLEEMPSKSISSMFEACISDCSETSTLDDVVSTIECRSWIIFIIWMDFKAFEWIQRSTSMLPYIPNYIIKSISLENINRTWRIPNLQINIPYFPIFPII